MLRIWYFILHKTISYISTQFNSYPWSNLFTFFKSIIYLLFIHFSIQVSLKFLQGLVSGSIIIYSQLCCVYCAVFLNKHISVISFLHFNQHMTCLSHLCFYSLSFHIFLDGYINWKWKLNEQFCWIIQFLISF